MPARIAAATSSAVRPSMTISSTQRTPSPSAVRSGNKVASDGQYASLVDAGSAA
jgi:hypothetical protein